MLVLDDRISVARRFPVDGWHRQDLLGVAWNVGVYGSDGGSANA